MTQIDDGHDFRDSKNKAEAYERKQKRKNKAQAERLVDKWNEWRFDVYESNRLTWTDQDEKDCKAISKILSENKSRFD